MRLPGLPKTSTSSGSTAFVASTTTLRRSSRVGQSANVADLFESFERDRKTTAGQSHSPRQLEGRKPPATA